MFWKVGADSIALCPALRGFWSLQTPVPEEKLERRVRSDSGQSRALQGPSLSSSNAARDVALPDDWQEPDALQNPNGFSSSSSASVSGDAPVPVPGWQRERRCRLSGDRRRQQPRLVRGGSVVSLDLVCHH